MFIVLDVHLRRSAISSSKLAMARATSIEPMWKALRAQGKTSADDVLRVFGVRSPPVDVRAIAQKLGVIVHYVTNPGYAGAVSSSNSRAEVWICDSDPPVRQRFTLAHELGHLLLHPLGKAYRDAMVSGRGTDATELAANDFAASLLMPSWMMSTAFTSTGGDMRRLARLFDVSESAMGYRLDNLELQDNLGFRR